MGIELLWSKERILEVYVNVAEMGRGIYGVEAAAQHYYGKPASDLSRSECALLATVFIERFPARAFEEVPPSSAEAVAVSWAPSPPRPAPPTHAPRS